MNGYRLPPGWEPVEGERYDGLRAAAYSGATERQLRYWDALGLVQPSIQQTNGKRGRRRLYSALDLRRLRELANQRSAGITLQHIRKALAQ